MSDEDTPSLVTDNLRPDHVGGSAARMIDDVNNSHREPERQRVATVLYEKFGVQCEMQEVAMWMPIARVAITEIDAIRSVPTAMVIDGKDAVAPEARTWPNLDRWAAMYAVVAAARRVCVQQTAGNMAAIANTTLRAALDALDAVEKRT